MIVDYMFKLKESRTITMHALYTCVWYNPPKNDFEELRDISISEFTCSNRLQILL